MTVGSLTYVDWACLSRFIWKLRAYLLNLKFLLKSLASIFSFNLLHFFMSVLLDEVGKVHIPSANSHDNLLILINLNKNLSLAKRVDSFRLPQKQYLEVLSFGIFIHKFAQFNVNIIVCSRNVNLILSYLKFLAHHLARLIEIQFRILALVKFIL